MNDPYAVLGLSPSASDEEVKRAYRALVKKYHPDNYVNNPLADLAEAKMKEINEAYDAIVKGRTQGGYQQQAQSNGNRYGTGGQAGQNPAFLQVRQLIVQNNLAEAERILRSTAANSAEWYFLMGSIAYKRGWMDDARQNFWHGVAGFCFGGKTDVHPVSWRSRQGLGGKVRIKAVPGGNGIHYGPEGYGVVRRRQRVGVVEIHLVLPRTLLVVGPLRLDAHLLQR